MAPIPVSFFKMCVMYDKYNFALMYSRKYFVRRIWNVV